MKTARNITLIIAAALIVIGLVIALIGLFLLDFKVDRLEAMELVEKTYPIQGNFSNISILTSDYDVNLLPAEDGVPRLAAKEARRVRHSMEVTDGTLSIQIQDDRGFRDRIGIFIQSPSMTLYLPESSYDTLLIKTTSGDISIPDSFTFTDAALKSNSGSIGSAANVTNRLSSEATSGSVTLSNAAVGFVEASANSGSVVLSDITADTLEIETTSGSIHLQTSAGNSIQAKTTSGSIHLRDILASCSLSLSSTSGGIRLSKCDAPEIQIKTTSGSVTGQLLTPKHFQVDTNSGTVSVPYAVAAEICRIETTSGSVRFAEPGE